VWDEFELRQLLRLLRAHGDQPLRYDPGTGMLSSPGCEGDYGCCAQQVDMATVADLLEGLLGPESK